MGPFQVPRAFDAAGGILTQAPLVPTLDYLQASTVTANSMLPERVMSSYAADYEDN